MHKVWVRRTCQVQMNAIIGFPKPQVACECLNWGAGVWVGAQVDPLVVFVGVVSELGWG